MAKDSARIPIHKLSRTHLIISSMQDRAVMPVKYAITEFLDPSPEQSQYVQDIRSGNDTVVVQVTDASGILATLFSLLVPTYFYF